MPKTIFLIALLIILSSHNFAQDCYDCGSRSVHLYDFEITGIASPTSDHDSIMNFYNALKITSEVMHWMTDKDPQRACLNPVGNPIAAYLDSNRALSEPGVLKQIAEIPEKEPWDLSKSPDYYIKGWLSPAEDNGVKIMIIDLQLLAGGNNSEIGYGLGRLDLYPAGNPEKTVADAVAYRMGSIFQKIRDFEVEKRNSGAPYAINPDLTGIAAKRSLNFNESTTVKFYLKDCDSEPLPNRTINFSESPLGSIEPMSVTTDGNGEASITFTAYGFNTGIAQILPSYSFTKPCEKPGNMKIQPVYIEIKRPADSWYLDITYSKREVRTKGSTGTSFGGSGSGSGNSGMDQDVSLSAWVKNDAGSYMPGYFFNQPEPLEIKFSGKQLESEYSNSFWSSPIAYTRENTTKNFEALIDFMLLPVIEISIGDGSYNISVSQLIANQSGVTVESTEDWDVINGTQNSYNTIPADPQTELSFFFADALADTVYMYGETLYPNQYTTETTSSHINQKCKWIENTHFSLFYDRHDITLTDSDWPGVGTSSDRLDQFFRCVVELAYNELSAVDNVTSLSAPFEYSLSLNYPNPFNPSTRIMYSIAKEGIVTLKIYNLLGQELETLVNEIKQPGSYLIDFDASELPSGTYFYQLKSGEYIKTNKMILLK